MSKLNIARILVAISLMTAGISAHAFSVITCGLSPAYWAAPVWENSNIKLRVLKADFTASEVTIIEDAINRYRRQSIGNTYLNITLDSMPPAVETAMTLLNNNSAFSPNYKDTLKWIAFQDDNYHTIYKASHMLSPTPNGAAVPLYNDVDEGTIAWTEDRLKNDNNCSTSTGAQKWHESRDIVIARPHVSGFPGGTEAPANDSINLYQQPSVAAGPVDIDYVVAHEIGHFTGLDHPDAPNNAWNYQYKPTIMLENYRDPQGGATNFGGILLFAAPRRFTQPLGDDLRGVRHMYPSSVPLVNDIALNAWEYGDIYDFSYQFKARPQYLYNDSWFGPVPKGVTSVSAGQWAGFTPVSMHNLGTNGHYISGSVQLGIIGPKKGFGANVGPGSYVQQSRDLIASSFTGPAKIYTSVAPVYYDDVPVNNNDTSYISYILQ